MARQDIVGLGVLLAIAACGGAGSDGSHIITIAPPPDAPERCNPLPQAYCADGEKCAWQILQDQPPLGAIACVPEGDAPIGEACSVGAPGDLGYSDCVKGAECHDDRCKQICGLEGATPQCDNQHRCVIRDGLFLVNGAPIAGLCEPL
jgi:hypothetical protein